MRALNREVERQREREENERSGRDPGAKFPTKEEPGGRLSADDRRVLSVVPYDGDGDDPLAAGDEG